jgi:hypothetical protein
MDIKDAGPRMAEYVDKPPEDDAPKPNVARVISDEEARNGKA